MKIGSYKDRQLVLGAERVMIFVEAIKGHYGRDRFSLNLDQNISFKMTSVFNCIIYENLSISLNSGCTQSCSFFRCGRHQTNGYWI